MAFHSFEKFFTAFIHIVPSVVMSIIYHWELPYFKESTREFTIYQYFLYPTIWAVCWASSNYILIYIILEDYYKRNSYLTLYDYFYKIYKSAFHRIHEKSVKLSQALMMVYIQSFCVLSFFLSYLFYLYPILDLIWNIIFFEVAVYNAATYYLRWIPENYPKHVQKYKPVQDKKTS